MLHHIDQDSGAKIIPHKPGRVREMVKMLSESGCDTVCVIPPAHKDKYDITVELITATKKANVPNVLFISSAGADVAEREKQPHLRQFIDLECLVMAAKGDGSTSTGQSPAIIRAGFYAEVCLISVVFWSIQAQLTFDRIFSPTLPKPRRKAYSPSPSVHRTSWLPWPSET